MTVLQGFAAQVTAGTRVLVMGSMPGVASLTAGQYYAHRRNRFWPLMQALCGVDPMQPYEQRLQALLVAGVGLWDVLAHCQRPGSLDAAIRPGSEVAVDLPGLLPHCPQLRLVACNGAAAARLYARHLQPAVEALRPGLRVLALPSTSPANAASSLAVLEQQWQALLPWLRADNPADDTAANAAGAHK